MGDPVGEAAGDRDAHRAMGERDVAGHRAEAPHEDRERPLRHLVLARNRAIPEQARLVRIGRLRAAEEIVDVDQTGS